MSRRETKPAIHRPRNRALLLCLSAAFLAALPGAGCLAQSTASGQDGLVASASHAAGGDAAATPATPAAAPGRRDPSVAAARQYRIGVDDLLSISVWHQPDLSRSVPVRPDGMISLPLVGEVQAAGRTTPELEDALRASLAQYIRDPELTVMVAQIRSQRVNIIGQVQHPGTFSLNQSMGVLDAIALAGGLRDFAKKKDIYVLRETGNGHRERLPYNYLAVLRGKAGAQDITLMPDDTVVIP
ncbi:MAG TPA: polysaccharide biosynthesis/export family protein [Acidobacteriaceae bacterium]